MALSGTGTGAVGNRRAWWSISTSGNWSSGQEIENADDIRAIWDRVYKLSLPVWTEGAARDGAERPRPRALGPAGQGAGKARVRPARRTPQAEGAGIRDGGRPGALPRHGVHGCQVSAGEIGVGGRRAADGRHCTEGAFPLRRRRVHYDRPLHGVGFRDDGADGGGTPRVQRPLVRGRHDARPPGGAGGSLREIVHPINIAGGEHEFTRFGFAQIAKAGVLDIWQPDVAWCGGITETLRILDLAREHNVPVVPHRGGEIWGLHVIAATDCEDLAETHPERWEESADELWFDEPRVVDGYLTPLDRPGFGVVLNEGML